ncbi:MAG: helix-turn-helix domain-containing protein, partial [Alloprevotella sp.]
VAIFAWRHGNYHEANYPYTMSQELLRLMKKRKPYLNPKLSLSDLAQEMHINSTYLTTVLNRGIDKSFYDFVNEFRIMEACSIIDEHPKLSNVASRSGFCSLSTFKRSFLKVKGMLPSQNGGHQ